MNWVWLILFVLFCAAVGGYVYLAEYRGARADRHEQFDVTSSADAEP